MKILIRCFLLLLFPLSILAKEKDPFISLLTCGPGDELYSIYGHTAIRVYDPENNSDIVYNYGTFDFNTPNFYLKFIKGDLQYFVSVSSYEDFIYQYIYYNRDVYEQKLNLTDAQREKIAQELYSNLYSDKRFYTYKFIDRNCTTMVADVINNVLSGPLTKNISDSGKTYRKILYSYLEENHFYENLGINLMFGYKTDKELDKLFLPVHLMESIEKSKNNNQPLTANTLVIHEKNHMSQSSAWNNIYTFCIFLLIVVIVTIKSGKYVPYFVLTGILGVFFMTVGFYSLHEEVRQNYNALLFNPIFLFLAVFLKKNNIKRAIISIYIIISCIVIYTLVMLNKSHFLMILPLIIAKTTLLLTLFYKYRKGII